MGITQGGYPRGCVTLEVGGPGARYPRGRELRTSYPRGTHYPRGRASAGYLRGRAGDALPP